MSVYQSRNVKTYLLPLNLPRDRNVVRVFKHLSYLCMIADSFKEAFDLKFQKLNVP